MAYTQNSPFSTAIIPQSVIHAVENSLNTQYCTMPDCVCAFLNAVKYDPSETEITRWAGTYMARNNVCNKEKSALVFDIKNGIRELNAALNNKKFFENRNFALTIKCLIDDTGSIVDNNIYLTLALRFHDSIVSEKEFI